MVLSPDIEDACKIAVCSMVEGCASCAAAPTEVSDLLDTEGSPCVGVIEATVVYSTRGNGCVGEGVADLDWCTMTEFDVPADREFGVFCVIRGLCADDHGKVEVEYGWCFWNFSAHDDVGGLV